MPNTDSANKPRFTTTVERTHLAAIRSIERVVAETATPTPSALAFKRTHFALVELERANLITGVVT